jgi:formate dehydrogenase alpha subunit
LETITITLNGQEVSGHAGMTILDLAKDSRVYIPTLCHSPYLDSVGACRICIVEDERSGKLMAACVTPIASGMVINTQSPSVIERRETIIKLMLASHPDTCIVCDKGNMCQLRKIASDMGIGLIDIPKIPQSAKSEEVNPFIVRDLSKCILCAKCIRSDQELVVIGAIDYINRGFDAKPATLNDLQLETSQCTFCGTCVAMCPTGALSEKEKTYRGATTKTIKTICPYCGCGCGISLDVRDNYLLRSKPDENNKLNRGTLCVKGSYGYDFVNSPDRLVNPLIKVDGEFTEASWDEALNLVASNFKQIQDNYDGGSLAVYGSSKCTNEENYLLQRFARCVLNTNNIDSGSRLYNSANSLGLMKTIGYPGSTNSISDLENSQVILVIGANPTSSSPLVGYAIKRAVKYNGAKLLVIDIRQNELTSWAHLFLQPKAGMDTALINGIAKAICDEKIYDISVNENTVDFELWSNSLKEYTPEYTEKLTGVSSTGIKQVAQIYAQAERASIVYGNGITQNINGSDAVKSLANLALLTGNVGINGGGIYSLQRENNGQGSCDMGASPDYLPAYIGLDNKSKKIFEEKWKCNLPSGPGLTAIEMFDQAKEQSVKGMYIVGENPVLSLPNRSKIENKLTSLDFLVVQDIFLTETAQLANVVLPAASFAEKEGTFTNFEGRVQRLTKAIESAGNSLPDWQIIVKLAEKMDCPMSYSSPQQIMAEIDDLTTTCYGLKYSEAGLSAIESPTNNNNVFISKHVFNDQTSDKLGRFATVQHTLKPYESKDGYPFTLCAGSTLFLFGSGTRSSRASRLNQFSPDLFLEICRLDAQNLKINDGDKVRIISPIYELTAVAKTVDTFDKGIVFMPISFPQNSVNQLFDTILDPLSKTPSLKTCPVKLERIENND